jgi:hypothetical protein
MLRKNIKNILKQYLNENYLNYDEFTFLLDGNCNIVWKHNNYNQGDEEELYNQIKKLTNENSKINRK